MRCRLIPMMMTLGIVSLIVIGVAHSADKLSLEQVREHLSKPHHHVLMRHAYAPGTGDPENFMLGDCFTQRNLDSGGASSSSILTDETIIQNFRIVLRFGGDLRDHLCSCGAAIMV